MQLSPTSLGHQMPLGMSNVKLPSWNLVRSLTPSLRLHKQFIPLATVERLMLISPLRFLVSPRPLAARRWFLSDGTFEFPDTEPEFWQPTENQDIATETETSPLIFPEEVESRSMQPSLLQATQVEPTQVEPTLVALHPETKLQNHQTTVPKPQPRDSSQPSYHKAIRSQLHVSEDMSIADNGSGIGENAELILQHNSINDFKSHGINESLDEPAQKAEIISQVNQYDERSQSPAGEILEPLLQTIDQAKHQQQIKQSKKQKVDQKSIAEFAQSDSKRGKAKQKNRENIKQSNQSLKKIKKQSESKKDKNVLPKLEPSDSNVLSSKKESTLPRLKPPDSNTFIQKLSSSFDQPDSIKDAFNDSTPLTDTTEITPPSQDTHLVTGAPQGYSVGGQVIASDSPTKPIAASDTVPAMLTPGEFVVNATDAQKHLPLLQHINQGGRLDIAPLELQNEGSQASENRLGEHRLQPINQSITPAANPILPEETAHLPLAPALPIHHHLEFSQLKSLQSGAFTEDDSGSEQQTRAYSAPVFRAKRSPHSASHSSIYTSTNVFSNTPAHSSVEWESVEDLLQIDSDQSTDSIAAPEAVSGTFSIPSFSASTISGFAEGGQVTDATPIAAQPLSETIERSSNSQVAPQNIQLAIEALAQEIYLRLHQRLEIERERQGIYSGRLPW